MIHLKLVPDLQTVLVSLLTLAALLLLVRELAAFTWVLLAPLPAAPAVQSPSPLPDLQAAYALFGLHSQPLAFAAPVSQNSGLTLLGVVAATDVHQGYALLRLSDSSVVAVAAGQEVSPGLTLVEVAADHLLLERAGLRETLAWPTP